MKNFVDLRDVNIIAPSFKKRLSGVTSSIIHLIPMQRTIGTKIAVISPSLPDHLPHIRLINFWRLWQQPTFGNFRVWHARRNIEMVSGIILRDILKMKLKLVFTSSSQRKHTDFTKWLVSKMDKVVATQPKKYFFANVPYTVIMHGIDLKRFKPSTDKVLAKKRLRLPTDQKIIGCFGRIRPGKGTDQFVDVMIDLLPKNENWSAIIVGRTTQPHQDFEAEQLAKINTAGLSERILFIDETDQIEIWYQALDLYITLSLFEGFGLTAFEAAACAVPTIAHDVGAFKYLIVPGKTGQIVPKEDQPVLRQHLESYLNNPEKCELHGKAARQRMENKFSLENEARALADIYNGLIHTSSSND